MISPPGGGCAVWHHPQHSLHCAQALLWGTGSPSLGPPAPVWGWAVIGLTACSLDVIDIDVIRRALVPSYSALATASMAARLRSRRNWPAFRTD